MGVATNAVAPMDMEKPASVTGTEEGSRIGAYGHDPAAAPGGQPSKPTGCVGRCGGVISHGVHQLFHNLGALVARRPWAVILSCVLVTMLCGAVRRATHRTFMNLNGGADPPFFSPIARGNPISLAVLCKQPSRFPRVCGAF